MRKRKRKKKKREGTRRRKKEVRRRRRRKRQEDRRERSLRTATLPIRDPRKRERMCRQRLERLDLPLANLSLDDESWCGSLSLLSSFVLGKCFLFNIL